MLSITDLAVTLSDGDKNRVLCPFCAGGASHELSFGVQREGNKMMYHCFRASCGVSGVYRYGGGTVHKVAEAAVTSGFTDTRYQGATLPLTEHARTLMRTKFDIFGSDLAVFPLWSAHNGGIGLPIRNESGLVVGEEIKYYPELTRDPRLPKSRIYADQGVPMLSWFKSPRERKDIYGGALLPIDDTLLVVEDQISALKAAQYIHSVALLGTNLSSDKITLIGKQHYSRVLLALDSDAFTVAVKSYQRACALITGLSITRLSRDIKNMSFPEIRKLVGLA